MKINRKTHIEIRLQNLLFSLLFLVAVGLVAWLSTQYSTQFDWTASHRHTLSDASRQVLDLLKDPVTITAYARENQQVREPIRDLVDRYSRQGRIAYVHFRNVRGKVPAGSRVQSPAQELISSLPGSASRAV